MASCSPAREASKTHRLFPEIRTTDCILCVMGIPEQASLSLPRRAQIQATILYNSRPRSTVEDLPVRSPLFAP